MAVKYYDNLTDEELTQEEIKKLKHTQYICKYDTLDEALNDIRISQTPKKLHWNHLIEIKKLLINYKGVELDSYYEWDNSIFINVCNIISLHGNIKFDL